MFLDILWYVFIGLIILFFFVGLSNKQTRAEVREKWFSGSFYIMLILGIFMGVFVYWFLAGVQTGGQFCDSPNMPDDIVAKVVCSE